MACFTYSNFGVPNWSGDAFCQQFGRAPMNPDELSHWGDCTGARDPSSGNWLGSPPANFKNSGCGGTGSSGVGGGAISKPTDGGIGGGTGGGTGGNSPSILAWAQANPVLAAGVATGAAILFATLLRGR